MADEIITVEWIATAQSMLTAIQKIDSKMERQEKLMQKVTDTTKKGAVEAAGSFNALDSALKKNEESLKGMVVGTAEFAKQKDKVDQLRAAHEKLKATLRGGSQQAAGVPEQKAAAGSLDDLASQLKAVETQLKRTAAGTAEYARLEKVTANIRKRHDELAGSIRKLGQEAPTVIAKVAGSFDALSSELRDAENELRNMVAGSAAFDKQKTKVDQLRKSVDVAEQSMQKLTEEVTHTAGSFNRLEKELKDNEAALRRMAIGTKEFDEQRKKVDQLRGALNRAKGELTGMKTGEATFGGINTAMATGAAAAGTLYVALQKVAEAQRDIVNTGSDAALNIDTMARKFQIQAGLADPQREVASKQIIQQASDAGVKAEQGFRTATALASSDFKDAINNGTLKIALEGMQGTSFTGSPEDYVSAMSQALSAYGLDKTPKNLQDMQVKLAGLFKATDFQAAELTDFAKNASVLEMAGMSATQALAGFGALREKGTAEAASTQMRNVSLGMMAPNTEGAKAIKSLGLKPEQLDMVGESFTDALSTLKIAVEKLPKEKQIPALEHMFGKENIAGAQNLMKAIPRIKELEGLQNNPQSLAADVETAKGSMQAGRNRLENKEILGVLPIASKLEDARTKIDQRDANLREIERKAAVDIGAPAAAAVRASGAVTSTIDNATGLDTTGGAMRGEPMSVSIGKSIAQWLMGSEKKQDEVIGKNPLNNAAVGGVQLLQQNPANDPELQKGNQFLQPQNAAVIDESNGVDSTVGTMRVESIQQQPNNKASIVKIDEQQPNTKSELQDQKQAAPTQNNNVAVVKSREKLRDANTELADARLDIQDKHTGLTRQAREERLSASEARALAALEENNRLIKEANDLARNSKQVAENRPSQPLKRQQPPVRNVRPGESPLPGAQVP